MINKIVFSLFFLFAFLTADNSYSQSGSALKTKPNIVLIVTDDQGIGDIGYLNNPFIKTPNLDRMAKNGVILSNFYVSPVCSPTRASLMTGRYSIRTGVHDTYNGGSLMAAGERTLAEYFRELNFNTGIFGKWHLGDNYPFRPMDQGFDTSLIFKGGGIGQPGDVANYSRKDSSYFNPVLFYNDSVYRSSGYCSDVYTDAAISYVTQNKANPFFLYLSFNAPHVPLQVPEKYYRMYADLESRIKESGNKEFLTENISAQNLEQVKRVYAMMSNIDDNVGRLVKTLKEEQILDNTIIIFISDNGPQQNRFKGGYKGLKGSVYEGGIKVPAFIYAPKLYTPKAVNETLAHIDLLPTLLDLMKTRSAREKDIDGRSFAGLLKGEADTGFNSRPLYFFWQRGFPEAYRNIAVRKGDFKLVGNTGSSPAPGDFELYNLRSDPGEMRNISSENNDIVNDLVKDFDKWHAGAISSSSLKLASRRIIIGSGKEPKSTLNRNDAKGVPVVWEQDNVYFYWDVHVEKSGYYNFDINFLKPVTNGKVFVRLAPYQKTISNTKELVKDLSVEKLYIEEGDYVLESWYQEADGKVVFPFYVSVESSGR